MKNTFLGQIRRPVKRQHADDYILIILLSFAAAVTVTRLFLEITNYPTIGSGDFHIAHVLWGGILLFLASLVILIFANRWVYPLGAVLAGTGVGLFIDEVGKFVTTSNDYFYPAAAPIIYAFFLLTVLIYFGLRRPLPPNPRIELYYALDIMQEVLDHDLEQNERLALQASLDTVSRQTTHPELSQLSLALLTYLQRHEIQLSLDPPNFWQRQYTRFRAFEKKEVTEKRVRALLIGGLAGLGLASIIHMLQFLTARFSPEILVTNNTGLYWFLGRVSLEMIVSIMMLAASILLLFGNTHRGFSYGYYSLILSLTTVNLLVFYFNQFSTIISALIQFFLLFLVRYYRKKFQT